MVIYEIFDRPVLVPWPGWLVWEHVVGNLLLWLSYVAMLVVIRHLATRKSDRKLVPRLVRAFVCLFILCGLGRFFEMLTLVGPLYESSGHVLVLTGIVSWWTVWSLRRARPALLALESRAELVQLLAARTYELAHAVDELAKSEVDRALLATVAESSDEAITVVDLDGNISYWNSKAERLFGYPAAEAVGRPNTFLVPPDRIEEERANLARAWAGERVDHAESVRSAKDGRPIDVSLTIAPIRDRHGRVIGISKIARDITVQKRNEEDLRLALDETTAATIAKGNFLANMSHEIRTPMNGVIGMAELLLDTGLNDLQRDYAETIRGSGEALLTVINDILDFSKIEAGKLSLELADFDLRTLIEQVADLLGPRVHQKSLEINTRVDPRVPAWLSGDPVRIRQVLTNLVGNAVKFTDRGEVDLGARLVAQDDERATVRISVRDTGIGIPADRQADVFESFTQIEGGPSRKYGGTGLGLSICRNLVDLMGGTIGLESVPGEGSTFWFEVGFGKVTGQADGPGGDIGGLHVLVVDDSETDRVIMKEALHSWGCRPVVVESGAEAFAKLLTTPEADPFGLILLDHQMPGMDGLQTARVIKGAPRFAAVPVVIITTFGTAGTAQSPEEEVLFKARLTKPLRRSQLYNALCNAAALSSPGRDRPPAAGPKEVDAPIGLRILLAEDNEVNRRVAVGLAERLGCRVDAVEDGRKAVEALDHDLHDLILMDVQMPEMDGFAATALIRERERATGEHIPILAMTAHAMQGDREKCLAAGMDGYLTKPIRPGPLREELLAWAVRGGRPSVKAATPPQPGGEAWSADCLKESFGEDQGFISEIVSMMLKGTPARLERMEAAVAGRDGRQVSREAHSLKGLFLTVGAAGLASACHRLDELGRLGDFSSIESLYPAVRDQWTGLEEAVGGYLKGLAVAGTGATERPVRPSAAGTPR